MDELKIFVTHTYGNNNELINSDLYLNVVSNYFDKSLKLDDKIYDNTTGFNIGNKSLYYCELTTQYWAWKNIKHLEYYGFCHYRRFFSFAPYQNSGKWNLLYEKYLNIDTIKKYELDNNDLILKQIKQYDIIVSEPTNFHKAKIKNLYEHYKAADYLNFNDINIMLEVIKKISPEYYEPAIKYLNGHLFYYCNMFIMKNEVFNLYNEWLFRILKEIEDNYDNNFYSTEANRTLGQLGERLLGIFITYIKSTKKYKIGNKQVILFGNTEKYNMEPFKPKTKNAYPVVYNVTNSDVDSLILSLASLIKNTNKVSKIYVYVLYYNLSNSNLNKIKDCFFGNFNIEYKLINIEPIIYNYVKKIINYLDFRKLCLSLTPFLFSKFTKILYLDSKTVFKNDVSLIFNTKLDDTHLIYCVPDILRASDDRFSSFHELFPLDGFYLLKTRDLNRKYPLTKILNYLVSIKPYSNLKDLIYTKVKKNIMYLNCSYMFDVYLNDENFIRKYVPTIYLGYLNNCKNAILFTYNNVKDIWFKNNDIYSSYFWKIYSESIIYNLSNLPVFINNIYSTNEKRKKRRFVADFFFPPKTRRREVVKSIYKKIKK